MSNFMAKMLQQDGTMVAVVDGKSYTVTKDSRYYDKLKEAFRNNEVDIFVQLVNEPVQNVSEVVQNMSIEGLEVKDGVVLLGGQPLANPVCEAIQRFIVEGLDYQPLVKFLNNLLLNPSKRAVDEGYKFLESCGLTVTEDGCFLAYKTVRENYLDKYSGKYDNRPGAVNSMLRNNVDDNCNNTCSYGFHVGALSYAGPGGWYNSEEDKVVICKVNPKDIVSVPVDHSCQKLRVCEYTVVADYKGPLTKPCYSGGVDEDEYDDDVDDNDIYEQIDNPDDMLIGWEYEFDYDGERRFGIVDSKYNTYIKMELIEPEEFEGEFRNFSKNKMENILCID